LKETSLENSALLKSNKDYLYINYNHKTLKMK